MIAENRLNYKKNLKSYHWSNIEENKQIVVVASETNSLSQPSLTESEYNVKEHFLFILLYTSCELFLSQASFALCSNSVSQCLYLVVSSLPRTVVSLRITYVTQCQVSDIQSIAIATALISVCMSSDTLVSCVHTSYSIAYMCNTGNILRYGKI